MNKNQITVSFVGVDVHERESQLAVFDPSGSLLQEKRIPTASLGTFIADLPGKKHVAIESVGFIYPIYDKLRKIPNCEIAVANPNNVNLIAISKLKHDRADAKVLGELLRSNFLPLSYLPDEGTREQRFLIGDRVKYGVQRAQLKTTLRWLLKRKGIPEEKKMFGADGRKRLRELSHREIDIR
jgi:transposase